MRRTLLTVSCVLLCAWSAADARIPRSTAAKNAFAHAHVCPSTREYRLPCPGYVIDHIKPLACGGKDAPSNMQFQTIADGKAKDKWELKTCGR